MKMLSKSTNRAERRCWRCGVVGDISIPTKSRSADKTRLPYGAIPLLVLSAYNACILAANALFWPRWAALLFGDTYVTHHSAPPTPALGPVRRFRQHLH